MPPGPLTLQNLHLVLGATTTFLEARIGSQAQLSAWLTHVELYRNYGGGPRQQLLHLQAQLASPQFWSHSSQSTLHLSISTLIQLQEKNHGSYQAFSRSYFSIGDT